MSFYLKIKNLLIAKLVLFFVLSIFYTNTVWAVNNYPKNIDRDWAWPTESFHRLSEVFTKPELIELIRKEKIDLFKNGLFPEEFLFKKVSENNLYKSLLISSFESLKKSSTALPLLRINQVEKYDVYFIFATDKALWLNSWSDVVRKKIFIFFNPTNFNQNYLLRCLAHEIAIISDRKISFIKNELSITNTILNAGKLDSYDNYPLYAFTIVSNPILYSVFSMIRAFKIENKILSELKNKDDEEFTQDSPENCLIHLEKNLNSFLTFYNKQNIPIFAFNNHAFISKIIEYISHFDVSEQETKKLFRDLFNFENLKKFMNNHVSITNKTNYCIELSTPELGEAIATLSSMGPRGNVGGGSHQSGPLDPEQLQNNFYSSLTSQYIYTAPVLQNSSNPVFFDIFNFYKSSGKEQ